MRESTSDSIVEKAAEILMNLSMLFHFGFGFETIVARIIMHLELKTSLDSNQERYLTKSLILTKWMFGGNKFYTTYFWKSRK